MDREDMLDEIDFFNESDTNQDNFLSLEEYTAAMNEIHKISLVRTPSQHPNDDAPA